MIARRIAFTNQAFVKPLSLTSEFYRPGITSRSIATDLTVDFTNDIRLKTILTLLRLRAIPANDTPLSRAIPQIDAATPRAPMRSSEFGHRLVIWDAQTFSFPSFVFFFSSFFPWTCLDDGTSVIDCSTDTLHCNNICSVRTDKVNYYNIFSIKFLIAIFTTKQLW